MDKNELIKLYRTMLTIRRFEERISEEFWKGNALGYIHVSIGQEAIPTGVCNNLLPDDRIVSSHRGHGHCIAKGADLNRMMAELCGRETGYCGGRGGSMHLFHAASRFYGGNAIVGGGLPLAVGLALADKMNGNDRVTAVF